MYNYKGNWNPVWSVVGETLQLRTLSYLPQVFTWSVYGNMPLQLAM